MKPTKLLDRVPAQVPTSGTCKIAFVGEAPSDYERLYGYPLVGPSGRVFDQLLRVSGLGASDSGDFDVPERAQRVKKLLQARAPYLVTNVFDEQLPGNDIGAWCAAAPEAKTWTDYHLTGVKSKSGKLGYLRPEYVSHLERLRTELQQSSPNLIVPLGATALWALTGVTDISLARGAVGMATLLMPGCKLLPTYHPAHIQQEWRLFHVAVGDLTKALAQSEFPEVHLAKRRIHIRPTVKDLLRWQAKLLEAPRLAVDIETSKHQITCIGFAPSVTEAFVIPFADFSRASHSYWTSPEEEVQAWKVVRTLLESDIPKTFQNGLYDAYYLVRQVGMWPRNYDADTRLQHHALYPELPKSLAFMGATYGTQGAWKLMRGWRVEKKDA